jgi:beta-carotene hydroxylase
MALPFVCAGAYFAFASVGWWPAAVGAVVALSFVSYGSTSHDLVHRSLGLPRHANEILLCVIELLGVRSGHAYRAAHLHHHARFPADDDIEGAAARMTWIGALANGVTLQPRVWLWATRRASKDRPWVIGEGVACFALVIASVAMATVTPVFLVYVGLMVAGSWVIPLLTSYLPHNPSGADELTQTRAFRGTVLSAVGLGHLYHLEHHLYPAVPHQKWLELARRLDPYLARAGIVPVRLWF